MEGLGEVEREEVEEEEQGEPVENEERGELSMHTLQGQASGKVLKVKGLVGKRALVVFIDSGSTHSFLNEETTTALQCPLQETTPLSVLIANGSRMVSQSKCVGFRWMMNGHEFSADLRILRLGGCHVVLGVDWMRTISPLVFDFNTLEVTFDRGGQKITLVGCQGTGEY